jgi:hypothetical protein
MKRGIGELGRRAVVEYGCVRKSIAWYFIQYIQENKTL